MTGSEVRQRLLAMQDTGYQAFQQRLLPTLAPETILGVRAPALRALARALVQEGGAEEFMRALPHRYWEENTLHGYLIAQLRVYDEVLAALDVFLPHVDNWATCDQLRPQVFRTRRPPLDKIRGWMDAKHAFTVRFGIEMLQQYYLDEAFDPAYLEWVAALRCEEYYVHMMVAWFFATALTKQYEAALPYLRARRLDRITHNKAIGKAIESCQIEAARKDVLRGLRWKQDEDAE